MKEIWKDIPGYEGLYKISNKGNIVSISSRWGIRKKPRKLKTQTTNKGYKRAMLNKNNIGNMYMVHRLVLMTFKPTNGNYEVNHKNYIRDDNRLENLEWLSHAENVRYSNAKKVNQYDLKFNLIKSWDCIMDIERKLNIDHRQIVDCCKGKQKTCKGFIFKYKEEKICQYQN